VTTPFLRRELRSGSARPRKRPTRARSSAYNKNMEYRRLGKTELMVSGGVPRGHWKRVDVMQEDFDKNRRDVVNRCMEVASITSTRVAAASARLLEGVAGQARQGVLGAVPLRKRGSPIPTTARRPGSWKASTPCSRNRGRNTPTCGASRASSPAGQHTFDTANEVVTALAAAKKQGKARHIGISSHDRRWLKFMIEYFPTST